jgi:hypothetical protein
MTSEHATATPKCPECGAEMVDGYCPKDILALRHSGRAATADDKNRNSHGLDTRGAVRGGSQQEPTPRVKAAVDVIVSDLLDVITATDAAGMPLAVASLRRIHADRVEAARLNGDDAELYRGLLMLAATALLMAGAIPKASI